MKFKLLTALILLISTSAYAQPVDLNATFQTHQNGQQYQSPYFNLHGVVPGDSGGWLVEFETNTTSEIYLKLNKTEDGEYGCNEPERKAENGDCGTEGELDDRLEFEAWRDEGNFQEGDSVTTEISEEWMVLEDENGFSQVFESDQTNYVGIRWELPKATGNEVQTDYVKYDLIFTTEYTETLPDDDDDGGNGGNTDDNDSDNQNHVNILNTNSGGGTGTLLVQVGDSTQTIQGAKVVVKGPQNRKFYSEKTRFTDENGEVRLYLDYGDYNINITKSGYESLLIPQTNVESSEITTENIQLTRTSNDSTFLNETIDDEDQNVDDSGSVDETFDENQTGILNPSTGQFFSNTGSVVSLLLFLLLILLIIILLWKRRNQE